MRPAHAPLLQAHKGSPAGNSPRGLFSVQRQRGLLVLALVLLAAALLLLLQRSGGGRVVGGGGVGGYHHRLPLLVLLSAEADCHAAHCIHAICIRQNLPLLRTHCCKSRTVLSHVAPSPPSPTDPAGSGNSLTLMGAAVQGLDSSSDAAAAAASASASASPQSLEEALQRARHAAALPPPDFRSHAEGLVLSPGAAKAAAACSGERCELIMRFVLAAEDVAHLVESGGCAVQHCPDALGVGLRPLPYTPHAFGNRCEPLWNRGALELVRQLADSSWQALEWGTGGSTAWFLTRLAHLTSIEAAPGKGGCLMGAWVGGLACGNR